MPTVIDWSPTVDPSELVRQTRDTLASGKAVVLPGDCGYLALWRAGTNVALADPALLAWGPNEVAALGLTVPTNARRLMFRAWPAPLVIEIPATVELPTGADGFARFRFPDHPLFELVIPAVAELGHVLVADTGCASANDAAAQLGDGVGLVINAGVRAIGSPTTVRVTNPPGSSPCLAGIGSGIEITRAGAFPEDEIARLAARIVLFVCTGNTCRSPLAEGLAKKLLATRLACTVSELPGRGFWVLSAGVAAYGGGPASEESCSVATEFGANLDEHVSRAVNPQLLFAADDVIAMTRSHLYALATNFPGIGPAPRLLCGDEDLDDPIGSGRDVYRACAETIVRHLERILPEWVVS